MFKYIDVFSGAGGMSLGFSKRFDHPFKPILALDNNKFCADTYNANFGITCTLIDSSKFFEDISLPSADLVIGGPPCQPHSTLGKSHKNDPRRQLWRTFLKICEISKAKLFVMENVPQFLGSYEDGELTEVSRYLGYRLTKINLCAADFGVPQIRWRAFIIGSKIHCNCSDIIPKATHKNPNYNNARSQYRVEYGFVDNPKPWKTLKDAISDLPSPIGNKVNDLSPPLDLHFGRNPTKMSLERYKTIPPGGNRFDLQRLRPDITPNCWLNKPSGGTDIFGRLFWDKPSVTIRTEFFKPEKGRYLHPDQNRPITHREAARLQSFPDDFVFLGPNIEIAKQIGNAVPPLLSSAIAHKLSCILHK